MPFVERLEARAYSRATEIVERVKRAVMSLFPKNLIDKVSINIVKTIGHGQIPIQVITASIKGKGQAKKTVLSIFARLSIEDRQWIAASIEQRLDEKCVLYLRLDKQEAFTGKLRLSKTPDVISVKIYLREYPQCDIEKTVNYIRELLYTMEREKIEC